MRISRPQASCNMLVWPFGKLTTLMHSIVSQWTWDMEAVRDLNLAQRYFTSSFKPELLSVQLSPLSINQSPSESSDAMECAAKVSNYYHV